MNEIYIHICKHIQVSGLKESVNLKKKVLEILIRFLLVTVFIFTKTNNFNDFFCAY